MQNQLLIGWQRGDITPPQKTLLMGQFYTRISEGTASPLTATALALETVNADGAVEQAVMLSSDLTVIDDFKPELLAALKGRCPGLNLHKITINATHTHAAPVLRSGWYSEPADDPEFMPPDNYRAWMVEQLADIVAGAWNCRQPGAIARGIAGAVVGRCRRALYADGSAVMYGDTAREDFIGLESCDDSIVNFLFTYDLQHNLTGMIINLACPSQVDESKRIFSADFWHNIRVSLTAEYGSRLHILPQCGFAGDMSPHLLDKEEKAGYAALGIDLKEIIARRVAAAVSQALERRSEIIDRVEFSHQVKNCRLPKMKVSVEDYELEKRIHQMPPEELRKQRFGFDRIWPFGPVCELISRYEQQEEQPYMDIECHIIRLGDAVFATNPFEIFVDYGRRIRCRSLAAQTFLVQLADAVGFYLPTARAVAGGSYSAIIKSNWIGPDGGDLYVENTIKDINQLFAEE